MSVTFKSISGAITNFHFITPFGATLNILHNWPDGLRLKLALLLLNFSVKFSLITTEETDVKQTGFKDLKFWGV